MQHKSLCRGLKQASTSDARTSGRQSQLVVHVTLPQCVQMLNASQAQASRRRLAMTLRINKFGTLSTYLQESSYVFPNGVDPESTGIKSGSARCAATEAGRAGSSQE